jgi:branched-chain amino acid transport system permease protein
MTEFSLHVLNAVQLGLLLFILAVGLTLVFGLMDTLNLAHGAFFTIGAYAGVVVAAQTGSFTLALFAGFAVPFGAGFLVEYVLLYPLALRGRSTHLDLALLTFGILFAVAGGVEVIFGPSYSTIALPPALSGSVEIHGSTYPLYRLFLIGLGLAIAALLIWTLEKTVVGSLIRGGVENREMLAAIGIDVKLMFALVFAFGSALAGFAGVASAPILSVYSHMGLAVIVTTLVVVVVGGLGNVRGSLAGALVVGAADTMAQAYWPAAELFVSYALLFLAMVFRPQGLFGNLGRAV